MAFRVADWKDRPAPGRARATAAAIAAANCPTGWGGGPTAAPPPMQPVSADPRPEPEAERFFLTPPHVVWRAPSAAAARSAFVRDVGRVRYGGVLSAGTPGRRK